MKEEREKRIKAKKEERKGSEREEREKYLKEFTEKPLKSVFNDKKVFRRYLFRKYNIIGCKF